MAEGQKILKIWIEGYPSSTNVYIGNSRSYWKYLREKREWDELIKAKLEGKTPEKPFDKAVVDIHYIFPSKGKRDPDNYSGKMILDPLVHYGVIEDDSFWVVKLNLSAEAVKGIKKTIITVKEGWNES